jgi:hypothetical protein
MLIDDKEDPLYTERKYVDKIESDYLLVTKINCLDLSTS